MVLQYYAHVRESANDNKKYQTVAQHLTGTAELCRGFGLRGGALRRSAGFWQYENGPEGRWYILSMGGC